MTPVTPPGRAATVRIVREGEWVRFVIRFEVLDLGRFRAMADAVVAVSRDEPGTVSAPSGRCFDSDTAARVVARTP